MHTRVEHVKAPKLVADHFGPDPTTVGGMATVIRTLIDNRIGADRIVAHATWHPDRPLATLRGSLRAAGVLLRSAPGSIAHFHLSEGGSFVREGALVALARRRRQVTVVTIHAASFVPFASKHPRLVSAVLGQAHLITCLDGEVLRLVGRLAPDSVATLLPNPVPMPDDVDPADETEELVVFAGEIGLRKGVDVLVEAWETIAAGRPSARCLIVGPRGDFAPAAGDRLFLRPPVDPVGMSDILRRARVVVLPSRAEGMPMILAEAMSLARPFVSSRLGGVSELSRGGGGVLVRVGDVSALANEVTRFLASPTLAAQVGNRGRQFCLETRSVEVIDRQLRQLYLAARADAQL